MFEKIFDWIMGNYKLPVVAIVVIIAFIIIITNAEKLLLLKGAICGWFSKYSTKARKVSLSAKVKGSILKSTDRFDDLQKEIIPNDLKIEWVEEEREESFIKEDKVIIRVRQSDNPAENLITSTAAYVNEGLLHNHRRYIVPNVMRASNFALIRNIVEYSGKNSVTYFEEKYLPEYLSKDDELYDTYLKLRSIDKNGMFINILLKEFLKASDPLFGDEPDPCLIAESRELVNFLYNIATRESEDNTKLEMNSNYFNIAIILTANDFTLWTKGTSPHLRRISKYIESGYDTVYMLGIGRKIMTAEEIARRINTDTSTMIYATQRRYKHVSKDGRRKEAVVFEISTKF